MSKIQQLFRENRANAQLSFLWAGAFIYILLSTVGFVVWGNIASVIIILAVLVPVIIFSIVRFPRFGVIFYLFSAYIIMYLMGFGINFPLGTVMDGILLLLIIAFFINQKKHPRWEIYKDSVSIIILVWIGYNLIQVANPTAESRLAWVYTIRAVAGVMVSYFVFNYFLNSVKQIRFIVKLWLTLSLFAALYAIKQEYVGFFEYEQRALDSNPLLRSLLFINGHWRKASIFSDPVAFSYNMVASSLLCISLILGPTSRKQKIVLGVLTCLFLNTMLYSGTRAAYVLVPAALVLLFILKFNRTMMLYFTISASLLGLLIYVPTSSPSIQRFQTAFRPSEDASYSVRAINQKRIQPFILSHPLGGGLGATGVWGVRFAPNSVLAQFPPDSGYVRVAVELGWIGLFLICTLFFIVLRTGIVHYFEIEDPELKTYCLAAVLIVFAISVGNFPQEAIVQFPLNVYFYLLIAFMNVTRRLDKKETAVLIEPLNSRI